MSILALTTCACACQGSLLVAGVSFAPWIGCALVGAAVAYVLARLLEAHLFAYDPRWFVWVFVALTTLCSIVLWNLVARPPPG
ncbi:hypothetical protein K2Z84_05810 [Candidatus Binatia bacterium]|jgi:hypothetical protein|nr:hypothetical protein [Candidatus Binatia bacterium]